MSSGRAFQNAGTPQPSATHPQAAFENKCSEAVGVLAGRGCPQSLQPLLRHFGCGASWLCLTDFSHTTSQPGQRHVHRQLVRATPLSAVSHFSVREAFKHMALNYFKRESLGSGPRRSCACSSRGQHICQHVLSPEALEASRCQCQVCQGGLAEFIRFSRRVDRLLRVAS